VYFSHNAVRNAAFLAIAVCLGTAGCSSARSTSNLMQQLPNVAHGTSASEQVVYSFAGGSDGALPQTNLISIDGELYGTTSFGGGACAVRLGCGTLFKVSSSGQEIVLHAFTGTDGEQPNGPLVDIDDHLIGTTLLGGGSACRFYPPKHMVGCGTIFDLSASGKLQTLYRFQGGAQGAYPTSQLTAGAGALYGVGAGGGSGACSYDRKDPGCGVVFKMSDGRVTVVYAFKGGSDGYAPSGGLVYRNGDFYGTTTSSDVCYYICGTVFAMSPAGKKTVLHTFAEPNDGSEPTSSLVFMNGILYGATVSGGSYGCGLDAPIPCGTVFEVTPSGQEKVLYRFTGGADGAFPNQLLALNGNLYGTTEMGGGCPGVTGDGTVFKLTPSGEETTLHQFCGGADGATPYSGLIYANGALYGTTGGGGAHNAGTVYEITL
jgi:uncharacterized repeat protein (TIGR03803 family)